MADSFQGTDKIDIQPGDVNVPLRLRLKAASASTANDGSIPYGSTINSVSFVPYYVETNSSSTKLIGSSTESGISSSNNVIVYMSYSSDLNDGLYKMTAKAVCSVSGSTLLMTREFDYSRIFVKDR